MTRHNYIRGLLFSHATGHSTELAGFLYYLLFDKKIPFMRIATIAERHFGLKTKISYQIVGELITVRLSLRGEYKYKTNHY